MAKTPERRAKATTQAGKAKAGSKKRAPKLRQAAAQSGDVLPETGWDVGFDPEAQLRDAAAPPLSTGPLPLPRGLMPRKDPGAHAEAAVLDRLWALIDDRKDADPELSHSARLLSRGAVRVAQKLGEEAVECVIEIASGTREGLIGESADVLYHLLVAWVQAGLRPEEVWRELQQRERASRRAEGVGREGAIKRLLANAQVKTTKIP
jgi:phosphoribosyl-ATP pyrophosphohydrolase